jgi:hypothetical protein
MKQFLIICAFWGVGTLASHAQTVEAMVEQLAALQALQQSTTKGYSLMTDSLDNIGQITDSEFQMHQVFFSSLAAIDPSLSGDPKLTALRNLQNALTQQIRAERDYWQQQQNNQP